MKRSYVDLKVLANEKVVNMRLRENGLIDCGPKK
jgi:hypothetical protein